ncbi:hypothetical protein PMAYCL1PPCAC_22428, partial [Pristionchus mayeri]
EEPLDDFPSIPLYEKHILYLTPQKLEIRGVENVPLFKSATSNETQEEQVEVKDKFLDDFADFKQEEPIADIYCPSTGTSRPI